MRRFLFALVLAMLPAVVLHAQPLANPCPADPAWVGWQSIVCQGACYWWLPGSWFGC